MKIVIDEKIPYMKEALEAMGHSVVAKAGSDIDASDVKSAEALFVRTRTFCNAALLDGSSVKFIGTATIGYDHIDADYCSRNAIRWHNAPGCNADAVLQYVQSSIYSWCKKSDMQLDSITLGIVGVGQIGGRVARWAESQGMRVLRNDPPREASGEEGFVPLERIAAECDIITFHPTLTRTGAHPSFHLADKAFFDSLQHTPLIINASRGPVVDNCALLAAYREGKIGDIVIDVWEGEPEINLELLEAAFIATPHIAGYSSEGKFNATKIVLQQFADFSGYCKELPITPLPSPDEQIASTGDIASLLLSIYNPAVDCEALKKAPRLFEELRNNYNFRREPSAYGIDTNMGGSIEL